MTLIVIVVIWLALFGLAFFTKRRFGVLGLALAAGVVLAQNATSYVGDYFERNQLPVAPLTYDGAATVLLIVAPAMLLLAGGPKYTSRHAAFIGALGFSLLGTFFLIGPLTTALPTSDMSIRTSLQVLSQWQNVIVVVALLLALLDTFMMHGAVGKRHRKSGKH